MKKISNNDLEAIISLETIVLGLFIGFKSGVFFQSTSILSYIRTFGRIHHIIGSIVALIFISLIAEQVRLGILAAIVFISVKNVLTSISFIDLLFIISVFVMNGPNAMIMLVCQILALIFN